MKRPPNDAWFDNQKCGHLFVYFTVHDYDEEGIKVVEWCICPDNKNKSDERAIAGSDGEIRGPGDQLDALIDRAMHDAREAAKRIARAIIAWAEDTNTDEVPLILGSGSRMGTFDDPRGRESESLAYQAERAESAGNDEEARRLFARAAKLEEAVVADVPSLSPRVKYVLALNAVALWLRAGQPDVSAALAHRYAADGVLSEDDIGDLVGFRT